jgi:hypothetical protein
MFIPKDKVQTVATTFNMDIAIKTKAQLYITIYNANLRRDGKKTEKLSLSHLINEALKTRLDKVELR